MKTLPMLALLLICLCACNNKAANSPAADSIIADQSGDQAQKGTYGYDKQFLQQHTRGLIELFSQDGAGKILLSPQWQARVMTSTANGESGASFGWLNYDLLASGQKKPQFNPIGGEERFWIGPEGGQFAFYFAPGDSFNVAHWQVPAIIDTVGYQLVVSDSNQAMFTANAALTNYSGSLFQFGITRKITMLSKAALAAELKTKLDSGIQVVAYQTDNTITNTGDKAWLPETGLASIWLLGMFNPSPTTTVIIPFNPVEHSESFITSNYFGEVPPSRLQVRDNYLLFTCDGKYRSKIGLSPAIAKPIAGSFDFANNTLTLVLPEVHKDAPYVNAKWEQQQEPYKGDVINAYTDGPLPDGSQMGPFYEIESSSPALQLKAGEAGSHKQVTCHLQGSYSTLNALAQQLLGVNLDDIKH